MSDLPMPALSNSLIGDRSPDECQACRARWVELVRWREHDQADRPTQIVVVLCKPCSGRLIEPHPRLYAEMDPNEHHAGSMELCQLCRHRVGLTCELASFNGGPGVETSPGPAVMHVRGGRRKGPVYLWYPARSCSGRQVLAIAGGEE